LKIFQNCGQTSLAYLTAKNHNLEEEADAIKASVDPEKVQLPEADPSAVLLRPPIPACQAETNWPLLTVSKSFFEGAMASRNKRNINAALAVEEPTEGIMDVDAGGWGDDAELKLDDDGEERDEFGDDEPIAADGGKNNTTIYYKQYHLIFKKKTQRC